MITVKGLSKAQLEKLHNNDQPIVSVAIDEIKPYPNNPRKITQEAVDAVAASIKKFKFHGNLVLDRNNVVINGHTRLKAAKQLGFTHLPCQIRDDLDDDEASQLRIMDNKTGEKSSWDYDLLSEEMKSYDLTSEVIEMNFSQMELQAILDIELEPEEPEEEDEEEEDDKPIRKKKKKHTIMLDPGQFLNVQSAINLLKEHQPDLTEGECLEQICTEWAKLQ